MAAHKGNNYAKGNKGGGRKTIYQSSFAEQAFKYSLLGATDVKLASLFGVTEETINQWKRRHKEFFFALKRGKEDADSEIVKSLYDRARGYTRKEEEIKIIDGQIVRVEVERYYPPDGRSAEYWLNNRQRGQFKAKQAEDDAPPVVIAVNVSEEEAVKISKAIRERI